MAERVIALLGQSNMENLWLSSDNPAIPVAGVTMWDKASSLWITPVGNGLIKFCNLIMARLPVGDTLRILPYAIGGSAVDPISAFPTDHYWTNTASGTPLVNFLDGVTASGKTPDIIMWHQGERDYHSTSLGQYKTGMDYIYSTILSHVSKSASELPFICCISGKTAGNNNNSPSIRQAQQEWSSNTVGASEGPTNYDIELLLDGVHHTASGYERLAHRLAKSALHVAGLESYSAVGSEITSVERVSIGTDHMLLATVEHNQGSTLWPENPWLDLTGFRVWNNNFSVEYPVTRVDAVSPTRIRLYTASSPGAFAKVAYQYNDADSTDNVLYSNNNPLGDIMGLPLSQIVNPIETTS